MNSQIKEKGNLNIILQKSKGDVLKEFEKVCMTDRSFERVKKEMHNIFDEMLEQLQSYIR